jgi:hypothetical protein
MLNTTLRRCLVRFAMIGGASLALVAPVSAQVRAAADTGDVLARAMGAEDRSDFKAASVAYRQVIVRALAPTIPDGDRVDMALLGLERSWAELGVRDSLLPVINRILLQRRSDPVARGMQLRTLVALAQDDAARSAFSDWRRTVPNDATPYREYARLLIQNGRAQAADSVLVDATRMLGSSRDLSGEIAQLNVALERWVPAASAYRAAVVQQPWLETAALFALQRVPVSARDSVRTILASPPVVLGPRRLLSELESAWGEPRKSWEAIAPLAVDDSTIAEWKDFGERAEGAESWAVARDAWTAVLASRGDIESARHAAFSALHAGDAKGALAIIATASKGKPGVAVAKTLLPVEIAALGELGRAEDAQKRIQDNAQYIDDNTRTLLMKPLVDAYLRNGELDQARAAAKAGDLLDDDETAGWLSLYGGDLAAARKRLVRLDAKQGAQIEALALLARIRTVSSPALGAAFLAIAKRDTTAAVTRFVALADSMPEAAPALLATAARLEDARTGNGSNTHALLLWKRIRNDYPKSAEAPEASLAWAQSLARAGDNKGAIAQLEAMLLDYSDSAMAPQARRELERLRTQTPPDNR